MNNQTILWSMLILPWLTLIFMRKEEIRRYIPLAFFTMVITSIVIEAGITLNLWNIRETAYPLNHTLSYVYGLAPVAAMWIFKFTFERFWLYIAADTVFNGVFAFLLTPWLANRGIKDLITSRFNVFLIVTGLAVLLYLYQMWQENAWSGIRAASYEPQPALKRAPQEDKTEE